MAIKEQIKILDDKIKQNKADYDLYRKNAKISALSSDKLDKYEYLTDQDLGYRPDPVQKAKFEHRPLGQVFNNKGLNVNGKQEGLLKRLKNTKDKIDNQSDFIRNQGDKQLELVDRLNTGKMKKIDFYTPENKESRTLASGINETVDEIKKIKDSKKEEPKFNYYRSDHNIDYFEKNTNLRESVKDIQDGLISLDKAKKSTERDMFSEIKKLENHTPKNKNRKNYKNKVIKNVYMVYNARNDILMVLGMEFF